MDVDWRLFSEKTGYRKVSVYKPSVYVALDQSGGRFLGVVERC
jgi:hypothetical protein